jgi:uncharacterized protein YcsI (UPF0317 family)
MCSERLENDPVRFRDRVRQGKWQKSTNGICPGYVQANLVILPSKYALDFTIFCLRNPQPCPIIEILEPGNPIVQEAAPHADIRTDLPKYCVFRDSTLVEEKTEIGDLWQDDLVTFLIGCSYTFEEALVRGGVPVKNYLQQKDPGVYVTSVMCRPAGIFEGPMVVSMRPIQSRLVSRAVQITSRFPKAHGAPVHVGDGKTIGVARLDKVDFGEPPELEADDVPVFWGCGITPQLVAMKSRVPFMITHKACHMFVTDVKIEEMATS